MSEGVQSTQLTIQANNASITVDTTDASTDMKNTITQSDIVLASGAIQVPDNVIQSIDSMFQTMRHIVSLSQEDLAILHAKLKSMGKDSQARFILVLSFMDKTCTQNGTGFIRDPTPSAGTPTAVTVEK